MFVLAAPSPARGSEPSAEERARALHEEATVALVKGREEETKKPLVPQDRSFPVTKPEPTSKGSPVGVGPVADPSMQLEAPETTPSAAAEAHFREFVIGLVMTSIGISTVGTIFSFASAADARGYAEEYQRWLLRNGFPNPCSGKSYYVRCNVVDEYLDAESVLNVVGSVSLAGTVLSTAALTYVLLHPSTQSQTTSVRAGLWVSPGGGALTIVGSF